jgi:hypothetical protein
MKTSRRDFFIKAGFSLVGASLFLGIGKKYLFPKSVKDPSSSQSGSDFWIWTNSDVPVGDVNGTAGVTGFNPTTKKNKIIPLSFYGHHLSHSKNSAKAATSEKWGTHLALIDLNKEQVIAEVKSPENVRFFGHTQFSFDSSEIYVGAYDDEKGDGLILVYSPVDLTLIRTFSSHGKHPHQIILFGPEELIIANTLSHSLAILNPKNGELIRKINTKSRSPAHFSFESSLDTFIVGGRNFPNAPKYLSESEKKNFRDKFKNVLSVLEFSDAFNGKNGNLMSLPHSELLSLEKTKINETWLSLVTLPHAKKIYLFDLKKREVISVLKTHFSPKGIAFSPESPDVFYVNSGKRELYRGQIIGEKKVELEPIKISDFGDGSHLSLMVN